MENKGIAEVEVSERAKMLLMVLYWERNRLEPVTVSEVVERLGWSEAEVKATFAELWEHKLVDVTPHEG